MTEIRVVNKLNGKYAVGDDGSVYRVCKFGLKKLKPSLRNGYPSIRVSIDNKQTWLYVHRLVAEVFIENPDNLGYVNHKDEDRTNNNVNNLEWCTNKYNIHYGHADEVNFMKQWIRYQDPVVLAKYAMNGRRNSMKRWHNE